MVKLQRRFLVDLAFIVERVAKTFSAAPLLVVDDKDYTFTFGCIRDLLRLRRKIGITLGMVLIGKEASSFTTCENIHDLIATLRILNIPFVQDPLNCALQVAHSIRSQFSHIVTTDVRFLQLCAEDCVVILPRKGSQSEWDWLCPESVTSLIGTAPHNVPTYLALTHASTIHTLTKLQALRLIELYGDIELIHEKLAEMKPSHMRRKLSACWPVIRQSYDGSKVEHLTNSACCTVQEGSLDHIDTEKNRRILRKYGFHSLLTLLSPVDVHSVLWNRSSEAESYHAVIDRKGMQDLECTLRRSKLCAIDTEADDKDPRKGTLLGVSFAVKEREAYFVPLSDGDLKDVAKSDVVQMLDRVFKSGLVDFIGHNIKYDYVLLRNAGLTINRLHFDTMLAAHECHGDWSFLNLPYLAKHLLQKEIKSYKDVVRDGTGFQGLPFREMVTHACQDADVTLRLYPVLLAQLKERSITKQFFSITMRLLRRLGKLEVDGITVDARKIDGTRRNLIRQLDLLKLDIWNLVGRVIDLESRRDLWEVLREAVSWRGLMGTRRLSLSILEQVAMNNPVARLIVEHKKLRNQIARLESISAAVSCGRIHPLFNQIKSRDGLVTTSSPSLSDAELLPALRHCFRDGIGDLIPHTQRSLDKLAQVAQDAALMTVRAAAKTKIDPNRTKHLLRRKLNPDELLLLFVVGQSDAEVSRKLFVERWKVATLRHDLRKQYPTMFQWLDNFRRSAQSKGYASNRGSRKYIDGLKSADLAKREQAMNLAVRWLICS